MGIKLGDISPLAGAISGKGMFGKGLAKLADSGAGMLVPMSYLAKSQRDKAARKATNMRGRPMMEEVMVAEEAPAMKKGGKVKKMASGGKVSSASSRGDGCAQRGKTKGRMV